MMKERTDNGQMMREQAEKKISRLPKIGQGALPLPRRLLWWSYFVPLFFCGFLFLSSLRLYAQAAGDFPSRSVAEEPGSAEEAPLPASPQESPPTRGDLRRQRRAERIQQVGLLAGVSLKLQLQGDFVRAGPSSVLGIRVKTRSDYRYSYTEAAFQLGATFGESGPAAFNAGHVSTHQLFRLFRSKESPPVAADSGRSEHSGRGLHFYMGFSAGLFSYSNHQDVTKLQPEAFSDLRANLSLALIYHAGTTRLRGKKLSHSWGFVLDTFSIGVGDHSPRNFFQNPIFLLGDYYRLEFFYSRLRLASAPHARPGPSFSYHWRLLWQMASAPGSTRFFNRTVTLHLDFFISLHWKWNRWGSDSATGSPLQAQNWNV